MTKRTYTDVIAYFMVVSALMYSAAILFNAHANGEHLGLWIWDRHQNQFSWYSRPLFLVPACYYAYRQNLWMIIGFTVLISCSLFWFAAPPNVSDQVSGYLEWERQLFFSDDSYAPLTLLSVVVVGFLFGLFYAFWTRNLWVGLFLINAGTITKIAVSVVLGKEAGTAAIVPSLSSLAIINVAAYVVWRRSRLESHSSPYEPWEE